MDITPDTPVDCIQGEYYQEQGSEMDYSQNSGESY
jgi:hypothetical protein